MIKKLFIGVLLSISLQAHAVNPCLKVVVKNFTDGECTIEDVRVHRGTVLGVDNKVLYSPRETKIKRIFVEYEPDSFEDINLIEEKAFNEISLNCKGDIINVGWDTVYPSHNPDYLGIVRKKDPSMDFKDRIKIQVTHQTGEGTFEIEGKVYEAQYAFAINIFNKKSPHKAYRR